MELPFFKERYMFLEGMKRINSKLFQSFTNINELLLSLFKCRSSNSEPAKNAYRAPLMVVSKKGF